MFELMSTFYTRVYLEMNKQVKRRDTIILSVGTFAFCAEFCAHFFCSLQCYFGIIALFDLDFILLSPFLCVCVWLVRFLCDNDHFVKLETKKGYRIIDTRKEHTETLVILREINDTLALSHYNRQSAISRGGGRVVLFADVKFTLFNLLSFLSR